MIQGSQEWLEWRRKGIGGSDIAAIIGVCKYSTPYKVWAEKVGLSTGFLGNYATQRGQELEARARARFELISLEDMPAALAIHPKYEICRVSLDGRRDDGKRILEIKCPGKESHESAQRKEVPKHYMPQVQYQLAVTGADACDYFSYYEDPKGLIEASHAIVEVLPDLEMQGYLFNEALKFWELVKTKTPPPLTDKDDLEIKDGPAADLCDLITSKKDVLPKDELEQMKREVVKLAGHSRVRRGRLLISRSVLASGKESYRLTISKGDGVAS